MSTQSAVYFFCATLDHSTCEIYADDKGKFTAYVPQRENHEYALELNEVSSFTEAEIRMRKWGLNPTWN